VTVEEPALEKVDTRWSHLYARLALGQYSFLPAVVATLVTVLLSRVDTLPWQPVHLALEGNLDTGVANWIISGVLMGMVGVFIVRMNTYVGKLRVEIGVLEAGVLDMKQAAVRSTLTSLTNPSSLWPAPRPNLISSLDRRFLHRG